MGLFAADPPTHLYANTVTSLLGEPPISNTLSSTTLFSMTDWFSLYKTYKATSNEQHLSNPTCNTQNENKNSQTPLLSNTFAVPSYQHASYRSRAGGQHKLVCCEHKPKGVANAQREVLLDAHKCDKCNFAWNTRK